MSLVDQLIQNAQKVVDSRPSRESSGGFGYRTVYITPNSGAKLNVRMLVPTVSPVIAYRYWIHQGDKQRALCTYTDTHTQCQVCDKIKEVENTTGIDSKLGSRARVVMYAQYVSSSGYTWSEDFPEPEQGSIILVMGPSGLYHLASQFLVGFVDRPEMISAFVADYQGQLVQFSRDKDKRTVMSPAMMQYVSAPNQVEFDQLLASLKPLDQLVQDAHPFEEHEAIRKEMVQELDRRMGLGNPVQTTTQMESSGGPAAQYVQPAPTYQQPINEPVAPATPPNYVEPTTYVQSPHNPGAVPPQQPTHMYNPGQAPSTGSGIQGTGTPVTAPRTAPQPTQYAYPPQGQVPTPAAPVQQPTQPQSWGAGDPNQALAGYQQQVAPSQPKEEPSAPAAPVPPVGGTFGQ